MSTTDVESLAIEDRATAASMQIKLRLGKPEDAAACAKICFEAFGAIAAEHGYPSDFPSVDVASGLTAMLLAHPGFYSVVAERDGEVVGSNFLDERGPIAGVGPITIRPDAQNGGVGRLLMEDALERSRVSGAAGVRLLQAAYHNRSLALYASLGFAVREPIACMQGSPVEASSEDWHVRAATEDDVEECNRVCHVVHGHCRGGELRDAIGQGSGLVVEREGRITGYASGVGFFGHAVGQTADDVKALLGAAPAFQGPGVLVPVRNAALFRWCIDNGLRVVQVMTLMTLGLYHDPQGAYLPSILY